MTEKNLDKSGLQLICKSKNGVDIKYDPIHSHAVTHLEDTPQLKDLVAEVASGLDLGGQEISTYFDMGRIVGTCDVVEVDSSDELVYGVRKNRPDDGLVPFTKSRLGDPCSFVALQLLPKTDGGYVLASAWIGTIGEDDEPFPDSPYATERSTEYWTNHAFVYGSQEIEAGSETTACSWRPFSSK